MRSDAFKAVEVLWLLWAAVWIVQGMRSKQTVRRQSGSSRRLHIILMVVAFVLLFSGELSFKDLGRPFLPQTDAVAYVGLCMAVAGWFFAVWARTALGSNWSGAVTMKEDHELITRGPYAWTRHPIYTGMLVMVAGTALIVGEVRALLALVLVTVGFYVKSRMEERLMVERFGATYLDYRRRVKALVPWVL